jgi:hypothetical protein
MTANELNRRCGSMAGCYRYENKLSGCMKACGFLIIWTLISPINFSRKTELTALMDKLQIHVCVCVRACACFHGTQMIRHTLFNL